MTCRRIAATSGLTVVGKYYDLGESAGNLRRKGLLKMLRSVRSDPKVEVDVVIVTHADRLFRNVAHFSWLRSELGISVVTADAGGYSLSEFIAEVESGAAQYELATGGVLPAQVCRLGRARKTSRRYGPAARAGTRVTTTLASRR